MATRKRKTQLNKRKKESREEAARRVNGPRATGGLVRVRAHTRGWPRGGGRRY